VNAADQQAIVGRPIAIVEMNTKETALAQGEGGSQGRLLARHQGVAEIDLDPEVRQANVADGEEGFSHPPDEGSAAWIDWLVLNADPYRRVVRSHLPEALDLIRPQPLVVDLERVVEPVIGHPQVHVGHPEAGRHLHGLLA
jgi:hypothetical protein